MPMTTPIRLCVGTLLVLLMSVSLDASADAAEAAFNKLFGKDMREVRHTRETDDDAQFAKRLLSEANSGKHDADLTIRLYEKAHYFGLRDLAGYPTANQALDQMLEKDATRKYDVGEMRLTLWEKWYEAQPQSRAFDPEDFIDLCLGLSHELVQAGDPARAMKFLSRGNRFASRNDSPRKHDVRDAITDLVRTRKALDEIAQLQEALETDPTAADKLAFVYLAQLDDPGKAAEYANQITDDALAAKVRQAAMDFELATPAQASEIGAYYLSLVTESKTREPIAMLIRARVWLTEFMSREQGEPAAIKAADEMLGTVNQALLQRGIGKKLARKMSSLVRGDGQFDRPADVQAAIDKAVQWLYKRRNAKTQWEQNNASHRNWGGYTALVVYALLMADEEPKVNGDLSRAVHFMMNADMKGTYPLCFRVHAWEVLPHRERYRQTLISDVTQLRRGATRYGFWGYTTTGKDVVPGKRLDLSTTLAGGLGLWIGEEVGGIAPKKVYWERTARALIKCQLDDNGWCYNPATGEKSQGAMTAGSLALLHASYPHLTDATKLQADKAIARGMQWMDENFSSTTNVNRGGFKNYYFAAVQHAGLFAGKRAFRQTDWYAAISEHLVKTQANDGSWGDVAETAFAVAFLCRGGIDYEKSDSDLPAPDAPPAEPQPQPDGAE